MDDNPIVRLQAIIGLSPSPIEKLFGLKSLFSGMTEGVYQLLNLNFRESVKANIFSPVIVPLLFYFLINGEVPKMNTKSREIFFFSTFILLSVAVNIFN
tara:strand:- start:484 stop:780 length:297 start_codon:yes stop_codon:yes gene_type:complete